MTVIRQRHDLIAWYERLGYRPTGETQPFPYGDERYRDPHPSGPGVRGTGQVPRVDPLAGGYVFNPSFRRESRMSNEILPFRIDVPDADIEELRARLRRTRWPEPATVQDWSQGVPLMYVQDLCRYWAESYDWSARQAWLNRFPQFRTEIDGLGIHFVHVQSPHTGALPLVLTHGWPGSFVEFLEVIGPLTDPPSHGGDAADAFHVVVPSLPGYAFSDKPASPGWGIERTARAWAALMARLGYERYGAQGGDWGAMVTTSLAGQDADHVAGIHLNMVIGFPGPDDDDPTDAEQAALASLDFYQQQDSGYSKEQSTRPQTVGYGLVDSPAGQCAWILEKFWSWTDTGGDPGRRTRRRPPSRQRHALLAPGGSGVIGPHVLGVVQQCGSGGGSRSDGRVGLPQGNLPIVPQVGVPSIHRHPILERAGQGWPLRRVRTTGPVRDRRPGLLPHRSLLNRTQLGRRVPAVPRFRWQKSGQTVAWASLANSSCTMASWASSSALAALGLHRPLIRGTVMRKKITPPKQIQYHVFHWLPVVFGGVLPPQRHVSGGSGSSDPWMLPGERRAGWRRGRRWRWRCRFATMLANVVGPTAAVACRDQGGGRVGLQLGEQSRMC